MTKEEPRKYLSTHKNKIVRIGWNLAGVIGVCVILRDAIKAHKNYIATDFTVSDLGKLGEHLIERGYSANDKVLSWKVICTKR